MFVKLKRYLTRTIKYKSIIILRSLFTIKVIKLFSPTKCIWEDYKIRTMFGILCIAYFPTESLSVKMMNFNLFHFSQRTFNSYSSGL